MGDHTIGVTSTGESTACGKVELAAGLPLEPASIIGVPLAAPPPSSAPPREGAAGAAGARMVSDTTAGVATSTGDLPSPLELVPVPDMPGVERRGPLITGHREMSFPAACCVKSMLPPPSTGRPNRPIPPPLSLAVAATTLRRRRSACTRTAVASSTMEPTTAAVAALVAMPTFSISSDVARRKRMMYMGDDRKGMARICSAACTSMALPPPPPPRAAAARAAAGPAAASNTTLRSVMRAPSSRLARSRTVVDTSVRKLDALTLPMRTAVASTPSSARLVRHSAVTRHPDSGPVNTSSASEVGISSITAAHSSPSGRTLTLAGKMKPARCWM